MQLTVIQQPNQISTLQKSAQIIDQFCEQFQSEHTKRAYSADLMNFFAFCESRRLAITEIIPAHVVAFLGTYDSCTPSSKNRTLAALKSFYKWLEVNDFTNRNPLKAVSTLKTSVKDPTLAFTDEEVKLILDSPNKEQLRGSCHSLALHILFHMGLRRSELSHIRLSDFMTDREHFVLRVWGKGNKSRTIPVSGIVAQEIKRYLDHRQLLTGVPLDPDDYLLQLYSKVSDRPVDPSTILRIVKKYAKIIGVDKRVSPHSCRATAISHLLEKDISIRNVAEFAGHSNTVTTQLYDKKRDGYANSAVYSIDY